MVTEKMIEAAQTEAESLIERAGIDIGDDHDMFVDDLAQTLIRFAALSTDVEPVEWQRRAGDYGWQRVNDEDLPHYREKGAELRALYDRPPQPAPSVAVKALEWHDRLKTGEREGFVCSSSGVLSYSIMLSRFRVYGISGPHDGAMEYPSLEEAKAAAQADYEARILSALSAQVQDVAGWQDISTAPKNTKVLAGYKNECGNWRTVTACYHTQLEWSDEYGDHEEEYAPEAWYEESDSGDVIYPTRCAPTHWMPLPAAPAAKLEGKP